MKKIYTTLLFSLLFLYCIAQTIQRVEPPNWWIGMQHDTIQLMLYGDNLASLTINIPHKGVELLETTKVSNPNYLFINIHITEHAKAGKFDIQLRKGRKTIASSPFELMDREEGRANIKGFDNSDAIYLITPDRFVNGNTSNDNVVGLKEKANRAFKGGRHGGDITGIVNSLDYIKKLGFTAIWLNPVLENDMEIYSYHGYSTTDYYKVDPRLGSNKEYKQLADEARQKGIKLIMDIIVNHCGLYHWWMEDLPDENWINQWPEYTQTNHRKTVIQDAYAAEIDKKKMTDGWFVPTMPDLNQRHPQLATYLTQNSIWWIEYLGLAGIRQDTYSYPDMHYMTDWTAAIMREYPNFNIVGEEWFNQSSVIAYWQAGKQNPNGYTSSLKSLMDFPLQMALVRALNNEETWGEGWIELYETLAQDFLYANPYNLVIFPDNHDMSRIFTQLDENIDLYKQALTFILTTRGIPQIYYGTEILMTNPGTDNHGIIRSDYPGGWPDDKINAFTDKGLSNEQMAARDWLSKVLTWRKNAEVVHTGKLMHFAPENGVYTYFRYNKDDKIMIILNKNTELGTLPLNRFSEIIKNNEKATDVITGKTYILDNTIELPARAALILEIK